MNQKLIILLCCLPGLMPCCKKENMRDCLKGTGEVITEKRAVPPFTKLDILDHVDVIITQDTLDAVTVEGGENLVPLVTTEVAGQTLSVRNNNTCDWVRKYGHRVKVHVSARALQHIIYGASGNVSSANAITSSRFLFEQWTGSGSVNLQFDTDTLQLVMHTGMGDFTLSGQTGYGYLYSHCYSWANCAELTARNMLAHNRGSGDFTVNVTDTLHATIEQSGSVHYIGNPLKLSSTVTGTGTLVKD